MADNEFFRDEIAALVHRELAHLTNAGKAPSEVDVKVAVRRVVEQRDDAATRIATLDRRAGQWKEAARLYRRRARGIYSNLTALCGVYPELLDAAKRYGQARKARRLAAARNDYSTASRLVDEKKIAERDMIQAAMKGWCE